jgi:hypothetical protein
VNWLERGIFAGFLPPRGKDAQMKIFCPLVLALALSLFVCGCSSESKHTESTQQAGVAAPMSTPIQQNFRPAGGMGRGY